jgi:hypothetical protein
MVSDDEVVTSLALETNVVRNLPVIPAASEYSSALVS